MIRSHQEKIVKYALKILNFNSQRIIQGKKKRKQYCPIKY